MFIHLTLWLGKLLVNPLIHDGTFDLRSAHYGTSFYLLVVGKQGRVEAYCDEVRVDSRHIEAVEGHLRRIEDDQGMFAKMKVGLKQVGTSLS